MGSSSSTWPVGQRTRVSFSQTKAGDEYGARSSSRNGSGDGEEPRSGKKECHRQVLHPSNGGMHIRARTGRVSYTFSSSLPALSLSAASHIKVSGVQPLVIPPLRLHSCFPAMGFFGRSFPW